MPESELIVIARSDFCDEAISKSVEFVQVIGDCLASLALTVIDYFACSVLSHGRAVDMKSV